MAPSSAANYENGITKLPLPLAGEGWGEGGYDFSPSLPLFPLRDPVILISILKSGSGIPSS